MLGPNLGTARYLNRVAPRSLGETPFASDSLAWAPGNNAEKRLQNSA